MNYKLRSIFYAGVLFLILNFFSAAYSEPVVIHENYSTLNLSRSTEYIEDTEKKLTIDDITGGDMVWTGQTRDAFNFGFTRSVYWFRFSVNNPSDSIRQWYLELDYPMFDSVTLYRPAADGSYESFETGDHKPFSVRDVQDKNFMFRMNASPGTVTYYLRIETTSSMNFSMLMLSPQADRERTNSELPVIWIYYGIMIIMAVYNLFIFF